MAIPIKYNIRNMIQRRGLTTMTALGIGLTVMTAVFLMMLLAGLKKAFVSSGDPLNVLVIRKGANSELTGGFTKDKLPGTPPRHGQAARRHVVSVWAT
jgi:putative ABC transport system permease protein